MIELLLQNPPQTRIIEAQMPVPTPQPDGTIDMTPQSVVLLQVQDEHSGMKITLAWPKARAQQIGRNMNGQGLVTPDLVVPGPG